MSRRYKREKETEYKELEEFEEDIEIMKNSCSSDVREEGLKYEKAISQAELRGKEEAIRLGEELQLFARASDGQKILDRLKNKELKEDERNQM